MNTIIEGYLFGAAMIVFIGPVFFTLLQATLQHGKRQGFALAFGIFISDALILSFCLLGFKNFIERSWVQLLLSLVGCIILFAIGIKYIVNPSITKGIEIKEVGKKTRSFFVKGFLVNTINPFVFGVWISAISYVETKFNTQMERYSFLTAALFGILSTDTLKVLLADKLQKVLTPIFLKKLFLLFGIILICFGARLLYAFFTFIK